jgi:hypothetical protein
MQRAIEAVAGVVFLGVWVATKYPWRARLIVLVLAVLALLLLTGCAGTAKTKVWYNPATWGTDRAAAVADTREDLAVNERAMVRSAQVEQVKTIEALANADESRPVAVARRTASNAHALLAQANGPVPVGDDTAARELVAGLLSEEVAKREGAERSQAKAEAKAADLADENTQLRATLEDRTAKLEEGYVRERKLANTVRNFWFCAVVLGGLFVLGQVLSIAARFNPAFAGVSAVANGVLNPAMAYAYKRAHDGLERVGNAVQTVRRQAPELAERMVQFMDDSLDDDHKAIARQGAIKTAHATGGVA